MMAFFRVLFGAVSDFRRHGCMSLAASLAFFTLLSFFPLVFILLYVIGFFVSQDRTGDAFLLNFLEGFFPSLGAELAEEIKRVAAEHVVRHVVLLTFAWFGLLVFYEVDYAVNVAFETQRKRHPLLSVLVSVALLGLLELLLIISYLVTQVLDRMVLYAPRIASIDLVAVAAHQVLLSYMLPFLLVLVPVTCLYRYVPHRRPAWRHAAAGALVLTLLWEFAKHLFSRFVPSLTVYGRMYGSMLVVVLFLLWVYYSAAMLLFGAELIHRLQIRQQRRTAD